jgi:3-deoxy-7-phosphoheptulonate synthase
MEDKRIDDVRIRRILPLDPPSMILEEFPITEQVRQTVLENRQAASRIVHGEDDRILVIVGPCSIHDVGAAIEYSERLKKEAERHADALLIIMRVYFEKPRTTIGWKGLINDPNLDQSFEINKGIRLARELLVNINALGIPAATEFLDLITPQYIAELISWGAIGARTTESQGHRELSSGLSCPVGFKNGTDGNLKIAVDAISSASRPHHFLSLTKAGKSAVFATAGNEDCHVILRGGKRPNYDKESVENAIADLKHAKRNPHLMIDCSHANSRKSHTRQSEVLRDIAGQVASGNPHIMGVMIESNLVAGNQDIDDDAPIVYGQSITDACIDFDETTDLLQILADAVHARRTRRI